MKLALNGEIYEIGGESPSYTAGDGVSIDSGVISLQNQVYGIYTQAEFNALSEEEKNNGTYFVDDGNSGGGSSSSDVYSTEEQVVGTWIDGKPLYRIVVVKTVTQMNGNSQNWVNLGIDTSSISVVSAKCINCAVEYESGNKRVMYGDTGRLEFRSFLYNSSGATASGLFIYEGCIVEKIGEVLKFTVMANGATTATATLCIEYTKTTDSAPPEASSAFLSTNVLTDVVDSITPSIMSSTMSVSDTEEVSE